MPNALTNVYLLGEITDVLLLKVSSLSSFNLCKLWEQLRFTVNLEWEAYTKNFIALNSWLTGIKAAIKKFDN